MTDIFTHNGPTRFPVSLAGNRIKWRHFGTNILATCFSWGGSCQTFGESSSCCLFSRTTSSGFWKKYLFFSARKSNYSRIFILFDQRNRSYKNSCVFRDYVCRRKHILAFFAPRENRMTVKSSTASLQQNRKHLLLPDRKWEANDSETESNRHCPQSS